MFLEEDFSFEKLESCLKETTKKSASSSDKISNKCLINLSAFGKTRLLQIINTSKRNSIIKRMENSSNNNDRKERWRSTLTR